MDYRHEWKHEINEADLRTLRMRLQAIMKSDPHAKDGKYMIRSLYFDTWADRALREKLNGVSVREKFRIRCYNGDTGFIHLEKKASGIIWAISRPQGSLPKRRRPLWTADWTG